MMLEVLIGLFSGGNHPRGRGRYGSVVYVNKGTSNGMRGYFVRSSPSDKGEFYPLIHEAGVDIAKRYADGKAGIISTLSIPFEVERLNAAEVERLLLECKLEAGARPSLSPELKKQLGLHSEQKINVRKLQSARAFK